MTRHPTSPPRRGHHFVAAHVDPVPASEPPAARSRLLSAEDVSDLLGVTPALVYALVRRGELPAVHVGDRYVRFRAQALNDWITAHETATPHRTR